MCNLISYVKYNNANCDETFKKKEKIYKWSCIYVISQTRQC